MHVPLAGGLLRICSEYLDGHCSDRDLRQHLADLNGNQLRSLVRALDRRLHLLPDEIDSDGNPGSGPKYSDQS